MWSDSAIEIAFKISNGILKLGRKKVTMFLFCPEVFQRRKTQSLGGVIMVNMLVATNVIRKHFETNYPQMILFLKKWFVVIYYMKPLHVHNCLWKWYHQISEYHLIWLSKSKWMLIKSFILGWLTQDIK